MPIKTYTLGPGTLTVGAGATALSSQVRSITLSASEKVTEVAEIPVLSGESIAATSTQDYTWQLAIKFLQDIHAGGVNEWSFVNRGTKQPFTYTPNTAAGTIVDGTLIPVPLDLGGDMQTQADQAGNPPESDTTWRLDGDPDITWGAGA